MSKIIGGKTNLDPTVAYSTRRFYIITSALVHRQYSSMFLSLIQTYCVYLLFADKFTYRFWTKLRKLS
ncbi:hypothetical protein QK342_14180 [Myroides odoratimimus]|uniref:hypothetical protein n=1 Tax=Myroides odoratimimus TaxID=76832 RepID=UPI00130D7A2A|nr:hypothetical protein [Myroides odoratimimus]WHT72847.1 hypothetical protein QK342_14180 [Myroides odoratimimus]WHU37431.1 hypothetical protein QNM93_14175 [Myroides odoratimimus]